MSPAPSVPVPFYVGGHTDVALKRAVRIGDGWTSAMMTCDELAETISTLKKLLAEPVAPTTPSSTRRSASTSSASMVTAICQGRRHRLHREFRGCSRVALRRAGR